jgi:hypothetical protein
MEKEKGTGQIFRPPSNQKSTHKSLGMQYALMGEKRGYAGEERIAYLDGYQTRPDAKKKAAGSLM